MSISCHVLDTTLGKPGAGISATLQFISGGLDKAPLYTGQTDADGRIKSWQSDRGDTAGGTAEMVSPHEGIYRLTFQTEAYFNKMHDAAAPFFPEVLVTFRCKQGEKYHVPLLLSPYAYSTYRGS